MNDKNVVVVAIIVVLTLVVVGLLVVQMGGGAIRSASLTYEIGMLELTSDKLLPGVPVTVSAAPEVMSRGRSSALLLRLPTGSVSVGDVDFSVLARDSFQVVVPCGSEETLQQAQSEEAAVRLVLVDHATQAVLAQSAQLRLLPPGPDCLFSN